MRLNFASTLPVLRARARAPPPPPPPPGYVPGTYSKRGGAAQVYLFASNSWKPVTRLRTEVEMRVQQATDVAEPPRDLASTESFGDIQLSRNGHSNSARHL